MAESLISLLSPVSPVAAGASDASLFGGRMGLSLMSDGTGTQKDAFVALLSKADNVPPLQASPARSVSSLISAVKQSDVHAFPIQPSNEAEWLQTTGEEVVAEPLPKIDEVQDADMAAIVFAPHVMPFQQQPEPVVSQEVDINIDIMATGATSVMPSPAFNPMPAQDIQADEQATPVDKAAVVLPNASPVETDATISRADSSTQAQPLQSTSEKDVAKEQVAGERATLEELLTKQAKNAVVHKAKNANKKTDTGSDNAVSAGNNTEAQANVTATTTQTTTQKSIMEAPVALELQDQKGLKLKAKSHESHGVLTDQPILEAELLHQNNAVSDAFNVSDVAAQRSDQAIFLQQDQLQQIQLSQATALNASEVSSEDVVDETAGSLGVTPREVGVRKTDVKHEIKTNSAASPNTPSASVEQPEKLSVQAFAQALADARAQRHDAMFAVDGGAMSDAQSSVDDTNIQIGGDTVGAATSQAIGGDTSQRAMDMNDVRMTSSIQLRQSNLAHASVHEQIQVQVKQEIAQNGGAKSDSIRVQLNPIELGQLSFTLRVKSDGTTHVKVEAERAETLDMLQRDSKGLAQALAEAGLQADAGSLEFSMSGDGRSGGEAQAQVDTKDVTLDEEREFSVADASVLPNIISELASTVQNYTLKVDQGVDIQA